MPALYHSKSGCVVSVSLMRGHDTQVVVRDAEQKEIVGRFGEEIDWYAVFSLEYANDGTGSAMKDVFVSGGGVLDSIAEFGELATNGRS